MFTNNNKPNKRKRQEAFQKSIPDISFHLVFCFLNLKELILISQCSHNFKRLVTRQSFINMYPNKQTIKIFNTDSLFLMSSSKFQHTINHIELTGVFAFSIIRLFASLTHLKKLTLTYKYDAFIQQQIINEDLDQIQSNSLLQDLCIKFNPIQHIPKVFESFSLFPNLTKLDMTYGSQNHFNIEIQMQNVRLLPALQVLDARELFKMHQTSGLDNLRRLCAQPGAPTALKIIRSFIGTIPDSNIEECAQLLQQLPTLDEIDYSIFMDNSIPTPLARWTRGLRVSHRYFLNSDMNSLTHFKKIESICLSSCTISEAKVTQLLTMYKTGLKYLTVIDHSKLSFVTISQCTELVRLISFNCSGLLLTSEFDLLSHCKKLEFIRIQNCGFKMNDLTSEQQAALRIPSKVFPSLKNCHIYL
jgi:hypothetical protein